MLIKIRFTYIKVSSFLQMIGETNIIKIYLFRMKSWIIEFLFVILASQNHFSKYIIIEIHFDWHVCSLLCNEN